MVTRACVACVRVLHACVCCMRRRCRADSACSLVLHAHMGPYACMVAAAQCLRLHAYMHGDGGGWWKGRARTERTRSPLGWMRVQPDPMQLSTAALRKQIASPPWSAYIVIA